MWVGPAFCSLLLPSPFPLHSTPLLVCAGMTHISFVVLWSFLLFYSPLPSSSSMTTHRVQIQWYLGELPSLSLPFPLSLPLSLTPSNLHNFSFNLFWSFLHLLWYKKKKQVKSKFVFAPTLLSCFALLCFVLLVCVHVCLCVREWFCSSCFVFWRFWKLVSMWSLLVLDRNIGML